MTRYARKVDANHAEIRDGLRALGHEVLDLSAAGQGIPDLMVKRKGWESTGIPVFLEVKRPDIKKSDQALTAAQERWWHFCWRMTRVVQTLDEAIAEVGNAQEKAGA